MGRKCELLFLQINGLTGTSDLTSLLAIILYKTPSRLQPVGHARSPVLSVTTDEKVCLEVPLPGLPTKARQDDGHTDNTFNQMLTAVNCDNRVEPKGADRLLLFECVSKGCLGDAPFPLLIGG